MAKPIRQTLEQAGYELVESLDNGRHVLKKWPEVAREEWIEKPNHTGYGLVLDGKVLAFVQSFHTADCVCNDCVGHIGNSRG
ncbi:hypothetical protein D3C84_1026460 [compost metagenome]|jgi:hypothetical protein